MRSPCASLLHKCFSLVQCLSTYPFIFILAFQKIFKGKEKHRDLIRELRSVHALKMEEQELKKADKGNVTMLKQQRDKQRLKVKRADSTAQTKVEQLQTNFIPLFSVFSDFSTGGVSSRSGRRRTTRDVWHVVQGADSSPGGAQDPRLHTAGWERPSPARGWGEWKEAGGRTQTYRGRRDLQTSMCICRLHQIFRKSCDLQIS